jgi:hypothetical protein
MTRAHAPARAAGLLMTAVGLTVVAGCGPSYGTITGTVTFNGQAVTDGQVSFLAQDGTIVTSMIDSNGRYRIPQIPVGPAKITVYPPTDMAAVGETIKNLGKEKGKGPPKLNAPPPAKSDIPSRYSDPNTSNLTVEVRRGEMTFDIPLEK